MTDTEKKDPINVLSESSPVRLGLAVLIVAGVIALYSKADGIEEAVRRDMNANYVSRDLFKSEMEAMRRENQMRADTLSDQIAELKLSFAAARAASATGK